MTRKLGLRIAATLSFVGMIVINVLANTMPINGLTTGEVSQLYPSLFTPAGITFSIWSVIYFLLTGFLIYAWTNATESGVINLLPAFIATCILNSAWILVWHFLIPKVSVILMLCLLFTLTRIFLKMRGLPRRIVVKILVLLPFTLYFAWICVATIANISALLVSLHWDGGSISPEWWTLIMMIVAAALAVTIMMTFKSPEFGIVVAWALIGIFLRWQGTDHAIIRYGAVGLAIVLTLGVAYQFLRKKVA